MLTRGWLIRIAIGAALAGAGCGAAAIVLGGEASGLAALCALVVLIGTVVAIPFAPRERGISSTHLARFVTFVIALTVVNGTMAAASGWHPIGETLLILGLVVVWVSFLGLVLAVPPLILRRRADAVHTRAQDIAIWGALAVIVLTECAGIIITVIPWRGGGWFDDRLLRLQAFSVIALGGCAAASLVSMRPRKSPEAGTGVKIGLKERLFERARLACLLALAVAWILIVIPMALNWIDGGGDGFPLSDEAAFYSFAIVIAAAPAGLAVWNAIGVVSRGRLSETLRGAAATFAVACTATFGLGIMPMPDSYGMPSLGLGFLLPFAVILLVLCIAISIAAAGTGWLSSASVMHNARIDSLTWRCPRCSGWFGIKPGVDSCCTRCGLAVVISLRDDRCAQCRYDLHGFGDRSVACPECGHPRQVTATEGNASLPAATPGGQHVAQVGAVHPPIASEIGG